MLVFRLENTGIPHRSPITLFIHRFSDLYFLPTFSKWRHYNSLFCVISYLKHSELFRDFKSQFHQCLHWAILFLNTAHLLYLTSKKSKFSFLSLVKCVFSKYFMFGNTLFVCCLWLMYEAQLFRINQSWLFHFVICLLKHVKQPSEKALQTARNTVMLPKFSSIKLARLHLH